MYHFFDAITNRKGDALVGYFVGVTDAAGNTIPLYADTSGTPIITVSGVADRALVDTDGNASFYVNEGEYTLSIYAADASTLQKTIPNIPMGASLITLASGSSVSTRAALSAVATPANLQEARLTESGREGMFVFSTANLSASVTADPNQGIYVAPSSDTSGASGAWVRKYVGAAGAKWFGAMGDGSTDDTTALTNALALVDHLHIPAGTYIVSALNVPANKVIRTAGFDTIIKRKSGIADGTRILNVTGSNVTIEDIAVQGLIASETGEQNHGVFIQGNTANGNLTNIRIGNVKATDIRGDAVYVGGANAKTVSQVKVGQIYANNCWRNGLTVADSVTNLDVESVFEVACGQQTVDAEPNSAATGPGIRIGSIQGRHLSLAGSAAAIQGIEIGAAYLDPSYGANSTPANPFDHKIGSQVSGTDNAVVIDGAIAKVGRLKVNGYTGQAIIGANLASRIDVTAAEFTNCCTADTVYNAFVQGTQLSGRIGELTATTTLSTHNIIASCSNIQVGKANVALVTSSKYMASCTDCRTDDLIATVSGAGNGGILISSCTRVYTGGGSQIGDRFFSFCTRCLALGVDATMATGYDVSPTATNTFNDSRLGGTFYHLYGIGGTLLIDATGNVTAPGSVRSNSATSGIGYSTGAGGTVTQLTSRTTGVTINKACGAITLVSAAGSSTWSTFTVTNSAVAATDTVEVCQKSGANLYNLLVTAVAAGSFNLSISAVSGTATESPVINFVVTKAVTA